MTKKHYEAIAAAIRAEIKLNSVFVSSNQYRAVLKGVAESLARYFAADNPKFDSARFLAACGVESNQY